MEGRQKEEEGRKEKEGRRKKEGRRGKDGQKKEEGRRKKEGGRDKIQHIPALGKRKMDGFWEGELFVFKTVALVCEPQSRARPHSRESEGSTGWTWQVCVVVLFV